jgi:nucleoside-diphosphate-sugar epimerase
MFVCAVPSRGVVCRYPRRSAVGSVREIIAAMRDAVPEGRTHLAEDERGRLAGLTRSLMSASAGAAEEHARFQAIRERGLALPGTDLRPWLEGRNILVTGGTGCVGSVLMSQLAAWRPRRLVSVSRGLTHGWPRPAHAEYARADIRDLPALESVVAEVRPDVLFHVAAQRDPGRAEREVHGTVTTNVLGTRNLIAAAERSGVPQVVYASTGKALRPYSPEVYAASKRAAEWIVSAAAARAGARTRYSAARFTHVVNNSLIYQRLLDWCADGVIRLHSADIFFYAQSALESAQLLLGAGLGARARGFAPGSFWVYAITDLGWPVNLLDLALGVLRLTGSAAPLYFSGYDPGYEGVPFPGLYDPRTAGEVSPLLSAFEAERSRKALCGMADAFPLELAPDPELDKRLLALEETCELAQEPVAVRAALDALSWSMLGATLRVAPGRVLGRAAAITAPSRSRLSAQQRQMLAAIEHHVGRSGSGATA